MPQIAILALPIAGSITAEDRFAELVSRQSRFVFQVAWAVLRHPQDAEDVAQETFLKLYRTGAWERIEDERAFLARTAWRLAVDRIRQRRPQAVPEERRSADPEQAAIAAQSAGLIDSLPEDLRQPLVLSAIEGMTSREIGLAMGIPEGTVRTRIMRARETLRGQL